MPSAWPRERLHPSLLDRLDDGLAPVRAQLERDRRALDQVLDGPQREELTRLLGEDGPEGGRPDRKAAATFATLGPEDRALLDRMLEQWRAHRLQARRAVALSPSGLRDSVLRDLRDLLNTTAAEARLEEEETSAPGWPGVLTSVLNYGIPALAGRVLDADEFLMLAQRIERAIRRFEPRLRNVRVRPADPMEQPGAPPLTCPVELIIEGELWGYPVPEHLLVRTVLDLEAGRVEIGGTEVPA